MNKSVFLLPLLAVAFSSCTYKDPADEVKEIQKQIDADMRRLETGSDGILNLLKEGGQPGKITITGGIINDDPSSESFGKLDPKVKVIAIGGTGQQGQPIKVMEAYMPVLSPPTTIITRASSSGNDLISIGCSEDLTSEIASLQNLRIKPIPAPLTQDVLNISAHTIVLCGKVDSLKETHLSLYAEELIMIEAEVLSTTAIGFLVVNTARLSLIGNNKIRTQGPKGPMTLSLTKSINLSVLFALDDQNTGTLEVISEGSSYQAKPSLF